MQTEDIRKNILEKAEALGWQIATAESCTGGMIATRLTDPAGASASVAGGLVTYSNQLKMALLDVPPATLETYGAVSDETVTAMARGCLNKTSAQLAVSVSGVAGPGGGTDEKPVGIVHFAVLAEGDNTASCARVIFDGDRNDVREMATEYALGLLADKLDKATRAQQEATG